MNISSIVVQTVPRYLDEVVQSLKECEVCDYHLHDEKGRVIITIEGEGVKEELEKLRVIEAIPHVVTADMQMAYSEDELDANMEVLNNSDLVPKMLNDETVPVNEIVYNGDLKKKDLESFADNSRKQDEKMSVVFTSTIKMADDGRWYIELKDMVDQKLEICKDMDEYAQKIEELGSDYGGNIDTVNWYKDGDVPVYIMDEIRAEMARHQAQVEETLGEPLIKQALFSMLWEIIMKKYEACIEVY